jgi:hypothetical protein
LGGGTVKLIDTIKIDGKVVIPASVTLDLCGHTINGIDNDTGGTTRPSMLWTEAVYGSQIAVTVNVAAGAFVVTAAATGLVKDDMVLVGSAQIFDPDRTSTQYAEIAFVESSNATTVTLRSPLQFAYLTADTPYIQKVTTVDNVTIKNGTIIGPQVSGSTDSHATIRAIGARNLLIDGIAFKGAFHADVLLIDCYGAKVTNCDFDGSLENDALAYGVAFGNATCDSIAHGNTFNNRRHAVSTNNEGGWGTGGGARGIVTRCRFQMNTINRGAKFSAALGGEPLDTHAAATLIDIWDNTVWYATGGAINVECPSGSILRNIVHYSEGIGLRVANQSRYSGRMVVDGNIVHKTAATKQGIVIEDGFISINTFPFSDLVCDGNKVYDAGGVGISIHVERAAVPLSLCNNVVWGAADDGIFVNGQAAVTLTGNRVRCGGDAYQLTLCTGFTMTGNYGETTSTSNRGILLLGTTSGTISGNTIILPSGSSSQGINATVSGAIPSTDVAISGNLVECRGANTATGIFLSATTVNSTIGANNVSGFNTAMSPGVAKVSDPITGLYTPTLTNVANCGVLTPGECFYCQTGDVVTVTGQVTLTPTAAANTSTTFRMTIPVASALMAIRDLAGTAAAYGNFLLQQTSIGIGAATATDEAEFRFGSNTTASTILSFQFSYVVKL